MRRYLPICLVAFLAFLCGVPASADTGDATSKWEISPEKSSNDLLAPRNEERTGIAYLGSNTDKKDGIEGAYVEKKVKCGEGGDWCTINLNIGFYEADKEKLKITLTSSGGTQKSVFLKGPTDVQNHEPTTQQFTVSSEGCKECTIKVELIPSAKSEKKNIQSRATVQITSGYPKCTETNQTNAEGRLVDEKGEPLPKPGS